MVLTYFVAIVFHASVLDQDAGAPTTDEPKIEQRENCPVFPPTLSAPVDTKALGRTIEKLKTADKVTLVPKIHPSFQQSMARFFSVDQQKTSKLEQFYGLIFLIAAEANKTDLTPIDTDTMKDVLLTAKVFRDKTFLNLISTIAMSYDGKLKKAYFDVRFTEPGENWLLLNGGKGFPVWKEEFCQTPRRLVFYGGIRYHISFNGAGNVVVEFEDKLDVQGQFGTRSIIDTDFEYLTVYSAEYLSGTPLVKIKAKVADREFEHHSHSFFLRMLTRLISDTITTRIEW